MATKLRGVLKREIEIGREPGILGIAARGFRLVPAGRRKGYEPSGSALVRGEAAPATALHASLAAGPDPKPGPPRKARA